MKNKNWLRSVAFMLVLCIAVLGVMHCYSQPKNFNARFINTFIEMPDNTVDGIIVGSSVVAHAWLSPVSWEKYGLAAYQFGSSVQPFAAIKGFIEYADKNQDLKYVIIDLHSMRFQSLYTSLLPAKVKEAYLNIPDIGIRYSMLNDILGYAERAYDFYGKPENEDDLLKRDDISLYIPLVSFHNRWVDGLEKADYVAVTNTYLGANDRKDTAFRIWDMTKYVQNLDFDGTVEINDFQKHELQLLFDYLEEKELEVLFINTPSFKGKKIQQELSSVIAYCKEKDYKTIDFATREMLDELGLDPATDFADNGHVNLKGAEKVTDYLCRYLIDNGFYYEDHRGQDGYEIWDEGLKNYREYYKNGWNEKGIDVGY